MIIAVVYEQRTNNDGDGYENEVALPQTLSRSFHLVHFVKCWQFFQELNSERLYQCSEKEIETLSRCLVFTSSKRREIRQFFVVVVQ